MTCSAITSKYRGSPSILIWLSMHKRKRGEPAAESPTKRSSSLRVRRCSQLRETQGPTTTGRIDLRKKKTWSNWKTSYKRAHNKARVKSQAAEGLDKFGAANAAKRVLNTSEVETKKSGGKVGMKAVKWYFDNLAATTINEKSVLNQLVANNAKLAATNKDLVAIVKKFPTILRILNKRPTASRKRTAAGHYKGRGTKLVPPL